MRGRSVSMEAPRVAHARSGWREACAVAAALCLLAVIVGNATRTGLAVHHRAPAIASVAIAADGHSTAARSDLHALAAVAPAATVAPRWVIARGERHNEPDLAVVDSVRTRGPPALAA